MSTEKSGNQENYAAIFDHLNLTNIQVWLNHSRYPSVDMATDFTKSLHDFASRYYGIYTILAGSAVSPAGFKSLYPIHIFDVSKQRE